MIAEETTPNAVFNGQPKKFVTWLFVLSSLMCFAGLTSAYIVRKAEGNWKIFDLPQAFYYTTVLIKQFNFAFVINECEKRTNN
jgi:cytochrome c oxidase subunit 3